MWDASRPRYTAVHRLSWPGPSFRIARGVNALTCVEPIDGNAYLGLIEVSRPRQETVVPMGHSSRRARG